MRIVFIGPPGVGKGTQCEQLARYLHVPHLSTGEMLRQAQEEGNALGQLATEYLESGNLVPDPVILQVIKHRLNQPDCQNGCLFDGFPRTLGQAETLDQMLKENNTPLDAVLDLDVSEEELMRRLLNRGRADDKLDVIKQRFESFQKITKPLVEYYEKHNLLHRIHGEGTPEDVFSRVREVVDSL